MLGLTSQSIGYKKQRGFKQVSEKGKIYIARKWKNVRKKTKVLPTRIIAAYLRYIE